MNSVHHYLCNNEEVNKMFLLWAHWWSSYCNVLHHFKQQQQCMLLMHRVKTDINMSISESSAEAENSWRQNLFSVAPSHSVSKEIKTDWRLDETSSHSSNFFHRLRNLYWQITSMTFMCKMTRKKLQRQSHMHQIKFDKICTIIVDST